MTSVASRAAAAPPGLPARPGGAVGVAGWAAAALAPAVVVAVDPRGWTPYGPLPWTVVSVLSLVAVAATLGAGSARPARRAPVAVGLGLAAWMGVAAACGLEGRYAWLGTPERHFGVLTWLALPALLAVGQALGWAGWGRRLVGGAVVAAGLVGGLGLVELAGWQPVVLDVGSDRLVGPFGSAAYTGAAVALLAPVALGVALDGRWDRRVRRAAAAAVAADVVVLAGTGARAAWFGVALAGLAVVAVRVGPRRRAGRRVGEVPAAGRAETVPRAPWAPRGPARTGLARARLALAGLALVGVVAGVGAATGAWSRAAATFSGTDGGARGRLDEWRVASRVVADHPLVGVGPEGYRVAFGGAVDEGYEQRHGRAVLPDRAHSALLDVAVAGGLPALGLWAALVALVGGAVLRVLRRGPPARAGVAAGLVAYQAQQLFLFPLAELDPVAWLLAGLVLAAVPAPGPAAGPRRVPVHPPVRRVAAVVPAALAVGALVSGLADVAADRSARTALDLLADGRAAPALDAAGDAVARRGDVLRYRLVAAEAARATGDLAGARAQLERARALSPGDPVAAARRAEVISQAAEHEADPAAAAEAVAAWADVVADDPTHAGHRLAYGVALARAGDDAGAEAQWRRAEVLAPTSPAPSLNLAVAHLRRGQLDQARAAVDRALQRDPANAQARSVAAAVEAARTAGGGGGAG